MTASVGPSLQGRGKHQLFDNSSNYLSHVPTAPVSDDIGLSQAFKVDDRIRGLQNKGTKRSWTAPLRPQSGSNVAPQSRSHLPLPSSQRSGLHDSTKRRRRELEFKTPVRSETRPRDILDIISQPSQSVGSQNVWNSKATTSQTPSVPRSVARPTSGSLTGRDDPRFLSAVDSLWASGKRARPTLPGALTASQLTTSFDEATQDSLFDVTEPERSPAPPPPLMIPGRTPNNTHAVNRELRPVEDIPYKYRSIFKFPYFNLVQSKVFDDVFNSDKSLILCAPTGSGKTAVFELALVRLLADLESSGNPLQFKAVYMAPMKALCSERYDDWKEKFEPLGVRCLELTGDTEMDELSELHNINIIITTPEKWDIMTRKWRDNRSLINKLQLFMVDEIHNLNDDNRGATMEVVISRMKTVDAACRRQDGTKGIKFVAVSATIPNVEDLAEWLGREKEKAAYYNLDESYRPVKLEKIVLGFPCGDHNKGFKFDYSLNYRISAVVRNYSRQKPTLVFVSTRKGTQQAAVILGKDAKFILDANHKERLRKSTGLVKEGKLRELILIGIGYHHAGLEKSDRKLVEEVFIRGDLPVLFATSTLAMGVNLPAHLVIVKCTQYYNMGVYQEYPESQILQMIGRAGRPQFDTSATAVLMTRNSTKTKYEQLLNGTEVIESSLHQHLIEHVNAEIVLRTISDVNVALEWIRSTFLYIRCMRNPKHYALPTGLSKERVEEYLQTLCLESVNKLNSVRLIEMDETGVDIKPTELGRNMARFCITFDTMTTFMNVKGNESVSSLTEIISGCDQFDISLRTNEKRTLNALNESKQSITIRYPMKGKKIKTSDMKINCLIQAQLGCLKVEDFSLSQDIMRIFRVGVRLLRCLVEVMWMKNQFETLLSAVFLAKCFSAKLWENSKFVSKQLEGIGLMLSSALVNAGLTTFQSLEDTNPREIELKANKKPPFGDNIRSLIIGLPKYRLDIAQTGRTTAQTCEIQISVSLANSDSVLMFRTAGKEHRCCLLIGDSDNNVVCQARIKDEDLLQNDWSRKVNVKRGETDDSLRVYYISQDWVGVDISTSFSPQYSSPRPRPIAPVKPMRAEVAEKQDSGHNRQNGSKTPRPCSHRCANKQTCAHECCKNGIQQRQRQAPNPRAGKRSEQDADDGCKIARVQEFIQRRMTPNPANEWRMNTTPNDQSLSNRFAYRPAPQLSLKGEPPSSVFDNPFDDSLPDIAPATDEYRDPDENASEYDEYEYRRFEKNRNSEYDSRVQESEKQTSLGEKERDASLTYGDFDCDLEDSPPMDFGVNSPLDQDRSVNVNRSNDRSGIVNRSNDGSGVVNRSNDRSGIVNRRNDRSGIVNRSNDGSGVVNRSNERSEIVNRNNRNQNDDLWKGPEIMMDDSTDLPDLVGDGYTTEQVIQDDSIEWSDGEFEKTNYDGRTVQYERTTYGIANDDDDVIDCDRLPNDVMKNGGADLTESEFDDGIDYGRVDVDVLPVMGQRERRRVPSLNESGYSSYSDPGAVSAVSALDRYSGPAVEYDDFAQTSPTDELLSKVPLPGEYEQSQYDNQGNNSLDDFDIPDHELAAIFQEDMSNAPSWKTSTPKSNKNYDQTERRFTFTKTPESLEKQPPQKPNSVKSAHRMEEIGSERSDASTRQGTGRSGCGPLKSSTARKLFTPSTGRLGSQSFEFREDKNPVSRPKEDMTKKGFSRANSVTTSMLQNIVEPSYTPSASSSASYTFQKNRIVNPQQQKPRPRMLGAPISRKKVSFNETLDYEPGTLHPDFKSARSLMTSYEQNPPYQDNDQWEGTDAEFEELETPPERSDQSAYFDPPLVKQKSASKNLVQTTIPSRYFSSRETKSDQLIRYQAKAVIPSTEPEAHDATREFEPMDVVDIDEYRIPPERQLLSFVRGDSKGRCPKTFGASKAFSDGTVASAAEHHSSEVVSKSSTINVGRPLAANTGTVSDNRFRVGKLPAATVSRVMNETREFKVDSGGQKTLDAGSEGSLQDIPSFVPLRVPVPTNDYSLGRPETTVKWVKFVLGFAGNALQPFTDLSLIDLSREDCAKWETELLRGKETDRVIENCNYIADAVRKDEGPIVEELNSCGVSTLVKDTDLKSTPADLDTRTRNGTNMDNGRSGDRQPEMPESVLSTVALSSEPGSNDDVKHYGTSGSSSATRSDVNVYQDDGQSSEVATSAEPAVVVTTAPKQRQNDVVTDDVSVTSINNVSEQIVDATRTSAPVKSESGPSPLTENRPLVDVIYDQEVNSDVITMRDVIEGDVGRRHVVMSTEESASEQRVEPVWRGRELDQFDGIVNKIFNINI